MSKWFAAHGYFGQISLSREDQDDTLAGRIEI